ncbi:MAG TPA: hypothetical protein VJR58_18270 [Vineibacter sp.]|nr:hypothetical protein [Vineibacter sp.]
MHAPPETLDLLDDLLIEIRARAWLVERKRGIFYRKSVGWLHFHGKPGAVHADLKVGRDWIRYPANTPGEWRRLLAALDHSAPAA